VPFCGGEDGAAGVSATAMKGLIRIGWLPSVGLVPLIAAMSFQDN